MFYRKQCTLKFYEKDSLQHVKIVQKRQAAVFKEKFFLYHVFENICADAGSFKYV